MSNGPAKTGELKIGNLSKSLSGKRLANILVPRKTVNFKKLVPASHNDKENLQRKSQTSAMLQNQFLIRFSSPSNFLNFSICKQKASQSKSQLTEDSYLKSKIAGIKTRKPSTVGPGDKTPVFFLRRHSVCKLATFNLCPEQSESQTHKRLRESIHFNRTKPSYPRQALLEDYERQKKFPIQLFANRLRHSESALPTMYPSRNGDG